MKSSPMTTNDVAQAIGISPQTFRRWVRAGKCPPFMRTPTGLLRFNPDDVEAWLYRLRVDPKAPQREESEDDDN